MKFALSMLSLLACTAAVAAEPKGLCEDTAANRQKVIKDARFEINKSLEVSSLPDWTKLADERFAFERHFVRYEVEFNSPSHTRAGVTFDCNGKVEAVMPQNTKQGEASASLQP